MEFSSRNCSNETYALVMIVSIYEKSLCVLTHEQIFDSEEPASLDMHWHFVGFATTI